MHGRLKKRLSLYQGERIKNVHDTYALPFSFSPLFFGKFITFNTSSHFSEPIEDDWAA